MSDIADLIASLRRMKETGHCGESTSECIARERRNEPLDQAIKLLSERSALVERVEELEQERDVILADNLHAHGIANAAETALSALRRLTAEQIATAYYEGFVEAKRRADWEDMYDWAALAGQRYAAQLHASVQEGNQSSSSAPSPTTSGARADGGEVS
jgi:hypothetical protein